MSTKKPTKPPRVTVRVLRLPHGADLALPAYQSAGAAGLRDMRYTPLHRRPDSGAASAAPEPDG